MPRHRLTRTSVVRYSAPVMGGTAAAIVSNSPSAGIGTGGLFRRKMLKDLCVATDVAEQVDDAEVFKFKPVRLLTPECGEGRRQ